MSWVQAMAEAGKYPKRYPGPELEPKTEPQPRLTPKPQTETEPELRPQQQLGNRNPGEWPQAGERQDHVGCEGPQ